MPLDATSLQDQRHEYALHRKPRLSNSSTPMPGRERDPGFVGFCVDYAQTFSDSRVVFGQEENPQTVAGLLQVEPDGLEPTPLACHASHGESPHRGGIWHMALSIKNPEAEQLARELSQATGRSITRAVMESLREALLRVRGRRTALTYRQPARPRRAKGHLPGFRAAFRGPCVRRGEGASRPPSRLSCVHAVAWQRCAGSFSPCATNSPQLDYSRSGPTGAKATPSITRSLHDGWVVVSRQCGPLPTRTGA